jgi:tetratricopeptide (TPR) repeat protein
MRRSERQPWTFQLVGRTGLANGSGSPGSVWPSEARDGTLAGAVERELEGVFRGELASVLCSAAAMRSESIAPPGLLARAPGGGRGLRSWRRTARSLLVLAELDGRGSPGLRRVAALLPLSVQRWPGPVELARAAARESPSEAARVAQAHAWLATGEPALAARAFTRLLSWIPRPRQRGSILEGLGAAHADLGRPRLALLAFDQAADDPGSSSLALLSALQFALLSGEVERARRAAARLELLSDASSARFGQDLARIRAWMEIRGPGLPWRPDGATRELFRTLARSPRSPAGSVCRALG